MSDSVGQSKIELWREKGLTLQNRLGHPPAANRESVDEDVLSEKITRGDIVQEIRLRFYPSVELDFNTFYAGSIDSDLDEVESMLFEVGFRNNPTAYVEITEKFGPDDGSYSRQFITEDDEFPYLGIGRPIGVVTWWNRLKLQYHITTFVDEDRDLTHLVCHREASAWLQPARHITVSEGEGRIGVRDFRNFWKDEFGEELRAPLDGKFV